MRRDEQRLRSTVEQLDAAAALIEGLGQIRKIGAEEDEAVSATTGREADRGDARGWLGRRGDNARARRSRPGLFNRLERAFAPLAYPG